MMLAGGLGVWVVGQFRCPAGLERWMERKGPWNHGYFGAGFLMVCSVTNTWWSLHYRMAGSGPLL